ncbi:hypothetical protein DXG01_002045, partial [Tephrocybe rancida]
MALIPRFKVFREKLLSRLMIDERCVPLQHQEDGTYQLEKTTKDNWVALESNLRAVAIALFELGFAYMPQNFTFWPTPRRYRYERPYRSLHVAKLKILQSRDAFVPLMATISMFLMIMDDLEALNEKFNWCAMVLSTTQIEVQWLADLELSVVADFNEPRVGGIFPTSPCPYPRLLPVLRRANMNVVLAWGDDPPVSPLDILVKEDLVPTGQLIGVLRRQLQSGPFYQPLRHPLWLLFLLLKEIADKGMENIGLLFLSADGSPIRSAKPKSHNPTEQPVSNVKHTASWTELQERREHRDTDDSDANDVPEALPSEAEVVTYNQLLPDIQDPLDYHLQGSNSSRLDLERLQKDEIFDVTALVRSDTIEEIAHIRFGMNFVADVDQFRTGKEEAWDHVRQILGNGRWLEHDKVSEPSIKSKEMIHTFFAWMKTSAGPKNMPVGIYNMVQESSALKQCKPVFVTRRVKLNAVVFYLLQWENNSNKVGLRNAVDVLQLYQEESGPGFKNVI